MDRVVFLDRDGTINIEKNYLYRKEDFEFIPGAVEAIKLIKEKGFKVVVVSNQAGVARGYYSEEDVNVLHRYINECLKKEGTIIDAFYFCPHHPVHGKGKYLCECTCRKPNTGMFEKAAEKFDIDIENSWMIGDNTGDIKAGINFGIKTILVATGYGEKVYNEGIVKADYYTADLYSAAQIIVSDGLRNGDRYE